MCSVWKSVAQRGLIGPATESCKMATQLADYEVLQWQSQESEILDAGCGLRPDRQQHGGRHMSWTD